MPQNDPRRVSVLSTVPETTTTEFALAAAARAQGNQGGSSARPAIPPSNQWQSQSSTNMLKRALSQANTDASKVRRTKGYHAPQSPGPSQFSQMDINGKSTPVPTGPRVYNPSVGPTRSTMTQASNAPSQMSTRSHFRGVRNGVCKLSGYGRKDHRLGDVIAIPFHTPNNNPYVDPNDNRLSFTVEGPVYSKRRMVVVLWIYQQDMFCVPLYTFGSTGMTKKAPEIRGEYVSMQNQGDVNFENQGDHDPVLVRCRGKPMDQNTTVHITGGMKVACNEDICRVGRITEESYEHLVDLWQNLYSSARQQRW